MIPRNINREHILRALKVLDEISISNKRRLKKYYIYHDGKCYPPKYVISLANKYANGFELSHKRFSGGKETNDYLESLGFRIEKFPRELKREIVRKSKRKIGPEQYKPTNVRLEDSEDICEWLHLELGQLPLMKYPFVSDDLPSNGIYFFYEKGELWGHGGYGQRIVRIGTHKQGNFRNRIKEHFLLDKRLMDFDSMSMAPKDRSIFRKNIGRALIFGENPDYLRVWNIDFLTKKNRVKYAHLRNIDFEKKIEEMITAVLRNSFSFRFIIIESEKQRIGSKGLEGKLIGTVAHCSVCKPSKNWLGASSPERKIRENGLWQVQHLKSQSIGEEDREIISTAIQKTIDRMG